MGSHHMRALHEGDKQIKLNLKIVQFGGALINYKTL